jgi:hypothetical protein
MSSNELPTPTPQPPTGITRRELGGVIVLWAGLVMLFLSPALFTGRYLSPADLLYEYYPWRDARPADWSGSSNLLLNDSVLQFEPWITYSAERLDQGAIPLWNPYNLLGAPFVGNMQSAVFYPGNWLLLLWPGGALLARRAGRRLFIAGLGAYVLAREVAQVRPPAALLAGVTFAFGSFLVVWLHAAMLDVAIWLPWLWWATARLVRQPGRGPVALLAGLVALHLLGGHPETMLHLGLETGAFALFQVAGLRPLSWGRAGRALGAAIAAYTLGVGLAAIQLLPFIEYLTHSASFLNRNTGTLPATWLPIRYAWTWISPDLYGNPVHDTWWPRGTNYNESNAYAGVLPLLLLPLAVFVRQPGQRRLAGFLAGMSVVAFGIVYHWPIIGDLAQMVPLLQIARNNRLLLLLQLALGLGAALGLDALLRQPAPRRRFVLALAAGLAVVLLGGIALPWLAATSLFGVLTDPAWVMDVWHTGLERAVLVTVGSGALLAVVILLGRVRPRLAGGLAWLLPLLLLADLWQAHGDYNPTVAPDRYFPDTAVTRYLQAQPGPFRVVGTGRTLAANANLPYRIANIRGYDALEPQSYNELVRGLDPAGQFTSFAVLQGPILDLLNVRYLLITPGGDPLRDSIDSSFTMVLDGGATGTDIYENRRALPRAWLTHQAAVLVSDEVRRRLRDPAFDPAQTALLEAPLPADQPLPAAPPPPGGDQVTIVDYQPEQVIIGSTSPAPGLLLLSDQAFPGWVATVDGQPTAIVTADHALRAVYVPAGTHQVRFAYQPGSFLLGAAITGGTLLLLGLIGLAGWRRAGSTGP